MDFMKAIMTAAAFALTADASPSFCDIKRRILKRRASSLLAASEKSARFILLVSQCYIVDIGVIIILIVNRCGIVIILSLNRFDFSF